MAELMSAICRYWTRRAPSYSDVIRKTWTIVGSKYGQTSLFLTFRSRVPYRFGYWISVLDPDFTRSSSPGADTI